MAFLAALDAAFDEGAGAGDIVGAVVPAVVTAAVHVAFWVTLFYGLGGLVQGSRPFNLDSLPEVPPTGQVRLSETVADLGIVALSIGALLWDRGARLTDEDGQGVSLLQPALWDGWMYVVIGLLLAGGGLAILAHRAGRWTGGLVGGVVLVNTALLVVVGWLAFDDRVVNPRFMEVLTERAGWDQVPAADPWVVVLLVGVVLVWDSVELVVRVRRGGARRHAATTRTVAATPVHGSR
jgi:hypothetical protein